LEAFEVEVCDAGFAGDGFPGWAGWG
jgi:hypothetical protein